MNSKSSIVGLLLLSLWLSSACQCDQDLSHGIKRGITGAALFDFIATWNSPLLDSIPVQAQITEKAFRTYPLQRLSFDYEADKSCWLYFHSDELICLSLSELNTQFWLCEGKIDHCTNIYLELLPCNNNDIDLAMGFVNTADILLKEFYHFVASDFD